MTEGRSVTASRRGWEGKTVTGHEETLGWKCSWSWLWWWLHRCIQSKHISFIIFFNILMFIYLFLRERETGHEWGRGRERGRHRILSRLQAPSCQHRAWGRAQTHGLWDHDLRRRWMLNQLSHPGAPVLLFLKFIFLLWERQRHCEQGRGRERERGRGPCRPRRQ